MTQVLSAHERRVSRRLEARGLRGLGEALCRIRGTPFGANYAIDRLFAVGAEGAVFLARDVRDGDTEPRFVAKIALLQFHRPVALESDGIRRRRSGLREEGRHLTESASPYMPQSYGVFHMTNPILDGARGGAFAEPEPVLLMERLPGFDLDLWLARMHRSDIDIRMLRRHLDQVVVHVLQGLWDLQNRGFYYADLRPGNVRIGGRDRRARLLDAGSLVRRGDTSGRFPYVPAYLPPDVYDQIERGVDRPCPTASVQAVMAGRTLFEVATGRVPVPGQLVDTKALWESRVSRPVADTIEGLCSGSFPDVQRALRYLNKHAVRRLPAATPATAVGAVLPEFEPVTGEAPPHTVEPAPAPTMREPVIPEIFAVAMAPASAPAVPAVAPVGAATTTPAAPRSPAMSARPAATRKTSWWRRLFGWPSRHAW